ncbi:MAG: MmcB family DNA repair protein [Pseudomonadota bacterium]
MSAQRETSADLIDQDPLIVIDGRQSDAAAALQRGVCRTLRAHGHSVITELSLANGRRADVVGLSAKGDITIVEVKSCLNDYRTDGKWHDYLDYCDKLYFAVSSEFPARIIPDHTGLILADRYGAELVREPQEVRLSAARRKAMMLCFARAAALRLQHHLDPGCGQRS